MTTPRVLTHLKENVPRCLYSLSIGKAISFVLVLEKIRLNNQSISSSKSSITYQDIKIIISDHNNKDANALLLGEPRGGKDELSNSSNFKQARSGM